MWNNDDFRERYPDYMIHGKILRGVLKIPFFQEKEADENLANISCIKNGFCNFVMFQKKY